LKLETFFMLHCRRISWVLPPTPLMAILCDQNWLTGRITFLMK